MSLSNDGTWSLPVILAWLRVNWGKMVLGGVACALLAFPVALLKPKTYDCVVTLLVSPPAFKDRAKQLTPESISEMMPRTLPVETYKVLALSPPVLDEVIRRVPLEKTGVKTLEKQLEVELVQMGSRSAQTGIMYTQALMFHAEAQDPQVAAKTAQAWAEVFKEQVDRTAEKGVGESFSLLETLHKSTKSELEQADLALAEHLKLWNLDLVKAQVDAKQKEYTEFEGALKQTEVSLASSQQQLKSLEEEFSKEPEKNVYFRAPSDDAYWIAGLENGGKPKGEPEKGLRSEAPNPNYVQFRASVVTSKEELEGLKAKKEMILLKLDELKKEMGALIATMADKTVERNKLARESESLKDSYAVVRAEYAKGRMADQTQASDIVIAGDAVVPDVPSSLGSPTIVLLAAFLGMLLTGGLLVMKEISEMAPTAGAADGRPSAFLGRASHPALDGPSGKPGAAARDQWQETSVKPE